ncbi:GNAT family N-acetyltransferase [uncultured Eudoraea sp.]|uniref:GNAT family N-acetyltransferase n=1 Tax=uncultured Eudoraea sp. TaxID=1035614 RepID=UPI00262B9EE2|nr:GNAT family N-acetyltransferase [uncultured Eudoraea sp.]
MNRSGKYITETPRLLLREFIPDDAENIWELNSDPEVMKYTGDPPFESVKMAREFLLNYQDYDNNGFGRWAVITKASHSFIGWCGLKLNEQNLVDIGFRFFRREWNKGYATEAASACLEYGFVELNLTEIIGRVARQNAASIKVLEKLSMDYWKKDNCKGIEDSLYYRLTKEQYLQKAIKRN